MRQWTPWPWHFLFQLIHLFWLAPIIVFLIFNLQNRVIGASVWCPFGKCASNAFNSATAVKYNKTDHDTLAGLQFAAQAIQVWFLIIATGLLYDIALFFAQSPQGLPIGYLMTHLHFGNLKNLMNTQLWTSACTHSTPSTGLARIHIGLILFALLGALLTIMVSLMGAAAAVLLIPTLQWVETEQVAQQEFDNIALAQNPLGAFSDSCDDTQLAAGSFSCTANTYGPSLDAGAATALASTKQFQQPNGLANVGTSQEAAKKFALNASDDRAVICVAIRQVGSLWGFFPKYFRTKRDVSLSILIECVSGEPNISLKLVC